MKVTASVDVTPVASYYGALSISLRQSLPDTIRSEAGATVLRVIQMTKSGSASRLRKITTYRNMSHIPSVGRTGASINMGVKQTAKWGRDQVWMRMGDRKIAVPMGRWNRKATYRPPPHDGLGWRMPDDRWREFVAAFAAHRPRVKQAIDRALAARGLTQKSWVGILEKIGAPEVGKVAEYIKRARPVKGQPRTVAFAAMAGANTSLPELTIANTSGLAIASGGASKLSAAMSIRQKFFERSLERGFFEDARFIARNYPWAEVK